MIDYFEVLYILNKEGLCYLQRNFDKNLMHIDEIRFSGMMTSIMMFSKEIFNESFDRVIMGERIIFTKCFNTFFLALAVKKNVKDVNEKEIFKSLDKIGHSFQEKYKNLLNSDLVIDYSVFEQFGTTIDEIFGIKTFTYLSEHERLLELLKDAETKGYDQNELDKLLTSFLDSLSESKLEIMLETIGEMGLPILKNKRNLYSRKNTRIEDFLESFS